MILTLIFLLFSPLHVKATQPIRWALSSYSPESFQRYAHDFKNELEKESQNKLKVDISMLDLSEKSMLSLLREDHYDIGIFYSEVVASYNPIMWVLDMPFLFRSDQHAKAVLTGPLKDELLLGLRPNNLEGLAFVNFQDIRILASTKELKEISELRSQPIRTSINPASPFFFNELGAVSLLTPSIDNRRSLESALTAPSELSSLWVDAKQLKATPFLYSIHNARAFALIVFNMKAFKRRTIQEQGLIKKVSGDIHVALPKLNIKFFSLTLKEKEKLDKATNLTYDNFRTMFSESIVKRIKESSKDL